MSDNLSFLSSENNSEDSEGQGLPSSDQVSLEGGAIDPVSAILDSDSPKISSIEKQAREQGWVPQDEWVAKGKDPELWHDARTHVNNKSFLDAIENQGKRIKQQQAMLDSMTATLAKAEERAYQQAIRDLEAQKFQAQQERDFNKYEQTIRAIDQAKTDFKNVAPKTEVQEAEEIKNTEYFKQFAAKHPWINESTPMARAKQQFATAAGYEFKAANPNATNEQLLVYVDSQYEKEFGVVKTTKASPVAGQNKSSSSRVDMDLTKEQKNMIRYFKNKGDDSALKSYLKALEQEVTQSRKRG